MTRYRFTRLRSSGLRSSSLRSSSLGLAGPQLARWHPELTALLGGSARAGDGIGLIHHALIIARLPG
jgi:hypothetical protein